MGSLTRRGLARLALLAAAATFSTVLTTVPAAQAQVVADAAFTAGGSVNQVFALDLPAGAGVDLVDGSSTVVDSGTADAQGAVLFKDVAAGSGYAVRSGDHVVDDLSVTDPDDAPDASWFDTRVADDPLQPGFGYITTRDGTTLSANVILPEGNGPFPVLVNYSGYEPSNPANPPAEVLLYTLQGYAVVGVNMRGTACSGGAFDFMEPLQSTDGYDVIETVARQPWSDGSVGMVGISYPGYSQLYVAATQPPSLKAISPLSPYADTYTGILYPGGVLNDGFAVGWAEDRERAARPGHHGWVRDRIADGDTECDRNQTLRLQSRPLLDYVRDTPFAEEDFSYLNPELFVDQIQVPVYLASQWQDEQTGGSAANLIELFGPSVEVYASFTNGSHIEPMAPSELIEAGAFLDLFVADRVPWMNPLLELLGPTVLRDLFLAPESATEAFTIPENRWTDHPDHASALAAWRAQPRIRIKWENGSVVGQEGLPTSPAVTRHRNWPLDGLIAEKLYLQPDGALGAAAPALAAGSARSVSSYVYDPTTKRRLTFDGPTDDMWAPHPDVKWNVLAEGHALSFVSEPYAQTVSYAGQGSVDLWLRSSAADTDLEVTLTEVRPDGMERFIQSGWLRASHRALDQARSTELVPQHTHQARDAAPLPAGSFTPVRVELFPFAHQIRAGSRLRVNIEAPGGNQPFWAFDALPGTATNEVGHSSALPSRVVLPRVPDAQAPVLPTVPPVCELDGVTTQSASVRNQPCRAYQPDRIASAVTGTGRAAAIDVTWQAPPSTTPPSTYRVTAHRAAGSGSGTVVPDPVEVPGDVTEVTFAGLAPGTRLEFTVTAVFGDGAAPASNASRPTAVTATPPGPVDPTPVPSRPDRSGSWPADTFGSDRAFVIRQLRDFTGSAPEAAVQEGLTALAGGKTAADYVADLRRGPDALGAVDPVVRLYMAYFGRTPDPAGLRFWTERHRTGTSLRSISEFFAQSGEFMARYGSVDHAQFVDLVYANVLGRAPDPAGRAFWISELSTGQRGRGQVMIGFSESPEYRRHQAHRVDVSHLWLAMLGRPPTDTELSTALNRLTTGTRLSVITAELLTSADYRP